MAAWVLDYTENYHKNYHEQTWNDLSEHIRDDPFMQDLIKNGVFSMEKLSAENSVIPPDNEEFHSLFD